MSDLETPLPIRREPQAPTGWRYWLVVSLGWVFLVLGLIGLVLPVMQGVLFLCIGLVLLSATTPWAQRWLDKLLQKFPRMAHPVEKVRGYVHRILNPQ